MASEGLYICPINIKISSMNIKILIHLCSDKGFNSAQPENFEKPLLYMLFPKPHTHIYKPPEKVRKVYLNPPGF
jgi:hypothetical protein